MNFKKIDNDFVCVWCGFQVKALGYTSRDHCPKCLTSLHVDINPGDRQNTCKGLLVPIFAKDTNKKGYVITYKCSKCSTEHNNKCAQDDNFNAILKVMSHTYNLNDYKDKFKL